MEPVSRWSGFAPPATPFTRRLLVYFPSGAYKGLPVLGDTPQPTERGFVAALRCSSACKRALWVRYPQRSPLCGRGAVWWICLPAIYARAAGSVSRKATAQRRLPEVVSLESSVSGKKTSQAERTKLCTRSLLLCGGSAALSGQLTGRELHSRSALV